MSAEGLEPSVSALGMDAQISDGSSRMTGVPADITREPDPEPEIESVIDESAGQSVFRNDLIMSEIYAWMDSKSDLVSCMCANKVGMWLPAGVLYRHIRWNLIPQLLRRGCRIDRFARILLLVRKVDCPITLVPKNAEGELVLDEGSPFQQFPNLKEIHIYIDRNLGTTTEQYLIAGQHLTIRKPVKSKFAYLDLHAPLIRIKGSTGHVTLQSLSCRSMPALPMSLASRLPDPVAGPQLLARLHDLRELDLTLLRAVNKEILPQLRENCPNLIKLALSSKGWGFDLPPALRAAGDLKEIVLQEGMLHWLYDLLHYEAVTMTCDTFGLEAEMKHNLSKLTQYQDTKLQSVVVDFVPLDGECYDDNDHQTGLVFAAKYVATLTRPCARIEVSSGAELSQTEVGGPDGATSYVKAIRGFRNTIALFKEQSNIIDDYYRRRGHEPVGYSRIAQ